MDSLSFDELHLLNLKFAKRIEVLEKENYGFKNRIEYLQNFQIQRDICREKFSSLFNDFNMIKLGKKESDDRVLVLEKELEDLKNSSVCAIEENNSINDFVAREKALRDKFAHIEGERDNLLGVIDNLKKESLKFEELNFLLESKVLKFKGDLTDSSSLCSNGNGSSCSNASVAKANTIRCFRASTTSEGVRKGQPKGPVPRRVFTCSHCGRKGHLRSFCYDLRKDPRKFKRSVPLVPKTRFVRYTPVWVRKSVLEMLNARLVDSHMLAHDSSHAISYG